MLNVSKEQERKLLILKQLVKIIPLLGFNVKALEFAVTKIDLPNKYWKILFPEGLKEVANNIEAFFDELMLEQLNLIDMPVKTHQKIIIALKYRIKLMPKLLVSKLAFFYSFPGNNFCALNCAWATCDKMWCYANDKSVDFNYYSKRSLLVLAYLSSIAYYINDNSENCYKTDDFIVKIVKNILNVTKFKQKLKLIKLEDIPIIRLFS